MWTNEKMLSSSGENLLFLKMLTTVGKNLTTYDISLRYMVTNDFFPVLLIIYTIRKPRNKASFLKTIIVVLMVCPIHVIFL